MFYDYYINVYIYFLNYCKGINVDEKQQVDTWLSRSFSLVLQVHLPPSGAFSYPRAYSLCVQRALLKQMSASAFDVVS